MDKKKIIDILKQREEYITVPNKVTLFQCMDYIVHFMTSSEWSTSRVEAYHKRQGERYAIYRSFGLKRAIEAYFKAYCSETMAKAALILLDYDVEKSSNNEDKWTRDITLDDIFDGHISFRWRRA